MRKIFIALCTMVSVITGNAQNTPIGENIELAGENPEELKVIYVNKDVSTHFIAMEDIKYVDISVNDIVGDIPTGNSLRIKPTKEGASGVITIVTERFFVQYMLVYSSDLAKAYTRFNIPYADLRSYMNPEVNLTKAQMYDYAHRMFISKNKFYDVSSKSNLMKMCIRDSIKTGKDIIYCTDIAADIGKYQKQMVELAVGDPALLLVSAKTELELVNRTADLTQYIYQVAIVGTDVNLMDNKQRIDLLKYVINELRNMRGIAYAVCRQMKTAKRNGVLQTLAPGVFKYKDNRSKLVDDLLQNYKVKPKR